MPDLGPHAVFILAAYAVTFVTIAALVAYILADDRRQRQTLAALEKQGIKRRSAKQEPAKTEAKAVAAPKPRKPRAGKKAAP